VRLARCDGRAEQRWTVVQDGTLRIHGLCLTAPGTLPAAGTATRLERCTEAADQGWALSESLVFYDFKTTEQISLHNRAALDGLCLSGSGVAGTQVRVSSCDAAANQAWSCPPGLSGRRSPTSA
jgi:hypothetical protein